MKAYPKPNIPCTEEIASAVAAIFHHPNRGVGPPLIIRKEDDDVRLLAREAGSFGEVERGR